MAGTPIICRGSIGGRRKIHYFDETYCRFCLPFSKTGEPGQLDSEEEHQSDEQNILCSPFQHQISLRYDFGRIVSSA